MKTKITTSLLTAGMVLAIGITPLYIVTQWKQRP